MVSMRFISASALLQQSALGTSRLCPRLRAHWRSWKRLQAPCIWPYLSPGLSAGTHPAPAPISPKILRSDEIRSIHGLRVIPLRDLGGGDRRALFLPIGAFIPSWRARRDWSMVRFNCDVHELKPVFSG